MSGTHMSDGPAALPSVRRHVRITAETWQDAEWPKGVAVFPLTRHSDDRGFFMEIVRLTGLRVIGFTPKQVSVSETAPGIVKAFHVHRIQSDLFCPIYGRFRLVLLDARPGPTLGYGYSLHTSPERPFVLRIPAGVAHGYEVLGTSPGLMLYITDQEYDSSDEYRVQWDDPGIGFPWNVS